ncbi:MAG: hypothetical protein LUQ50_13100 [Methanospirillum sp.]|uniref:hypothetical protein n=1 Tax=Methanospirillum sp. TaxID=45200 RepID=UPI0023717952|nr:hypothetical protein [Methanospirillum sp.]MDD1729993.1 hypothetical protein [Methanospirillum sp.]
MSVKRVYRSVAIGATILLVIIGAVIVLSTLSITTLPDRTDDISSSYNDSSLDGTSVFSDQMHTDGYNKSSDTLPNTPDSISSLYISLDSVRDVHAGDLIVISGTTNLQPGSSISLKITPAFTERTDEFSSKTTFKSFLGLMGHTRVFADDNPVHRWSWTANSSDLSPNLYEVTASFISPFSNSDQIPGIIFSGTSRFILTQRSV